MESIYAIAGGLALRVALSTIARIHSPFSDHSLSYKNDLSSTLANIDSASRSSLRLTSALVGVWEGVVTLHFLKKMPNSFDPYVAYGVRLFIDLIVTESLERLVVVVIWTVLGMIMADVAPSIWKEMGLHRIWRRTRRDLYKITRVVEKSVPKMRFRVPALPKVRVVRFGEDNDREQRELERERRRRERRERRRAAAEDELDEEGDEEIQEEPVGAAPQPVRATSILHPPPSTLESTVPTPRRRVSPSSELASILELGSAVSTSVTPPPQVAVETGSRRSREREPEPVRVKERERAPIGLPTPSNTTVTAPTRSYHRYEPEPSEVGTASPAISSASTNDLTLEIDYDPQLDDDNRSITDASYTAASSPQFTSASNLTPRIELLSPPDSEMLTYIGLPDDAATPIYEPQDMGHKLQFLDTAIDNAPEVDAEEELMSDYAAEEEMLAIAGGTSRYEDEVYDFEYEHEDRAATPKPRRNPYLPPTPSDSAPFGRRTFARRDLPRDTSSILSNEPAEEEKIVVPPTALLQQIPDDVEKEEPPKDEVKPERPPTPPAKDESYRATPPPSAAAKLRSSSSKKAASAIGAPSSTEKLKKSSKSKSKSVISEGASTPNLATLSVPALPEPKVIAPPPAVVVEQQAAPADPISVATAGLKPPSGPVGMGLLTPISADRSAGNIPVPPRAPPAYAPFNIPQPPPPGTPTLLGGFGNPGVPGPDDSRVGSRGLPPAYVDWTGSDYGQEVDDEDDMYLDEQTSKIQIELFKRKEAEDRAAQDLFAQQAAQDIIVQRMQQHTPDQTIAIDASTAAPLVSSPSAESPLPSPITPLSPLSPNTHISSISKSTKDKKRRPSGVGIIESKKTDPVKSLVSHWNSLGDTSSVKDNGGKSYSDIGMVAGSGRVKRSASTAGHASSKSVVGGGAISSGATPRPPVLRRTSTPLTPTGISPLGFAAGIPLPAGSTVGSTMTKVLDDGETQRAEKDAAALEAAKIQAERQREEEDAAAAVQARMAREEEERRLQEESRRIEENERRICENEQRLAEEAQRLRDEELRLVEEALRLKEQEAAAEKALKEAEEMARLKAEQVAIRKAEEEAEAKRVKKEEKKKRKAEEKARKEAEELEERRRLEEAAERERLRLLEEETERERLRAIEEEAERERQRVIEEEAERERQRVIEEEAERERQRLADEVAEKARALLAEEAAERARQEEEEQLRIQREKNEEEDRARKEREREQEKQWKLEQAERKSELAAAASQAKRTASVISAANSKLSHVDKDKDLPPPPAAPEEPPVAPPSAFGEGIEVNWRPETEQKPAANGNAHNETSNPWDAPIENRPQTPTQQTVNLAGIGAGGRSDVGRSVVGRENAKSPVPDGSPEIEVKSASENQYASARDGEGEEEDDGAANEPEGLHVLPDDMMSVSAVTEATEVSQDIEKRLRKALLLRAQKADLEQQLKTLQAKSDAGADEIKAAERVVRKYEKKIRRLYEDCQVQTFFYPSAEAASAILLQGVSPETARDHINEAFLWHLTPEARSISFKVTLPLKSKKTNAHDKAMRAAVLEYVENNLKLTRTVNQTNKKLHTIGVEESRWDEWIAGLRRESTSNSS